MEILPVEMIAHMMSYLPLDARRLGTTNRKFGKAFRLFHLKSRIPVDLTVFSDKPEFIVSRNGRSTAIKPLKITITTKDGNVTLEITEDHIEIEKNTDAYTIEFCKSFFTLAEICGLEKPTYVKFLTNFIPLVTIETLNLNIQPRRSLSTSNRVSLISLLLESICKKDCRMKTIKYDSFPLEYVWLHLFAEGKRPLSEVFLIGKSYYDLSVFEHHPSLPQYATIGLETSHNYAFFSEMFQLIEICHKHPEYDRFLVILNGSEEFVQGNAMHIPHYFAESRIQLNNFEEFDDAEDVSGFPAELEVRFPDQNRGFDAFLELKDEGATYRFVAKTL